jgi:hypothetical protein
MTQLDNASLELLREALIICAAASAGANINLAICRLYARRMGHRGIDDERLLAELDYLAGKGLIESPAKLVSPAMREWRITAAGRDYAEMKGLA